MDLIAGLPRDSFEGFRRSLEGVLEMEPENITVHTLALKKGSALMERGGSLPSGAEVAEMLDFSREILIQRGYRPYYLYRQKNIPGNLENVGFSKKGKECLYNILIMEELHDIIAVGAGTSSKIVHQEDHQVDRIENLKDIKQYITRIDEIIHRKELKMI